MPYSSVADVILISGMYNTIINEAVGTGNNSITEFTLDKKKVVAKSEKIYVAGTLKTRGTDYTINNDRGIVTFGTAPSANDAVTADYKYVLPETVSSDIEEYITGADAEIDSWTGKKFTTSTEATEYFEGRARKITASGGAVEEGQYWDETEEDKYLIMLRHYPVVAVSSLTFLKDDGTTDDTLTEDTDFHVWTDIGKIWLITKKIPTGHNKKKVKVVYTYGYSAVPETVRQLSAVLAAMRWCIAMTGGSYVDMATYSLGGISVSVGVPYMNLKSALDELEKRMAFLLNVVGRDFRMVVI